jgi:hypothetical protein
LAADEDLAEVANGFAGGDDIGFEQGEVIEGGLQVTLLSSAETVSQLIP